MKVSKCNKGYSWKASAYSRRASAGCPYYAGQKHSKILCVETGKLYSRYYEISADLGMSIASVSMVINGNQIAPL